MEQNRKNTLLVVEDSPDLQYLTKELFEAEGYEVYCASNGQEALDFLRTTPVKLDLILLDLMMPVMDGYQFRKEQMADTKIADIPVVVVTADGNAKAKALQLGVKDSYNKSSGVDIFLDVVKRNISPA